MGFERSCFRLSSGALTAGNLFLGKLTRYPRNCQVKILSNHINSNIRYFSTLITSQPFKMNPFFITGLTDAIGSFIVGVVSNNNYKTGLNIKARFQIALHNKDIDLLLQIQNYFGVGKIGKHTAESVIYRVESIKELEIIINHFYSYVTGLIEGARRGTIIVPKTVRSPLGQANYPLCYPRYSHRNINIRYSSTLTTLQPVKINPLFITGFVDGEGCFNPSIAEGDRCKTGGSEKFNWVLP